MTTNQQALDLLTQADSDIRAAYKLLSPSTPPPVPAPPPPKSIKLTRLQKWLGPQSLGVYIGVESDTWRAAQFHEVALQLKAMGVDYACVKFGEWGIEWYDRTAPEILAAFRSAGVGMVPYYFNRPDTWRADADICARLANLCGGVLLDCEEQWLNHGVELAAMVNTIRNAAGGACIMVSGYGDPITAFNDGRGHTIWPFDAINAAVDAYQPQTYLPYWQVYAQGWQAGVEWSMKQCADSFTQKGLGLSFPIAPLIAVPLHTADYTPVARFFKAWGAGLCLWEYKSITPEIVAACKAGLK